MLSVVMEKRDRKKQHSNSCSQRAWHVARRVTIFYLTESVNSLGQGYLSEKGESKQLN
jgi:hypothetical protein